MIFELYFFEGSCIPVPVHIDKAKVKGNFAPDLIKSSVGFVVKFDQVSMGSIAERRISRVLTVAQLIVPTF